MALDLDKTINSEFSEKADRKAYELSRMPPELIKRMQENDAKSEELRADKLKEQEQRYPSEKDAALAAKLREKPTIENDPPIKIRRNMELVVEGELREKYKQEIDAIKDTYDQKNEALIKEHEAAHPEIEKDRAAIEKMREQKRQDKEATRIREHEHSGRGGRGY